MRDKSFFYCSSSHVDRPSEASDLQSLLEAPPEISTLSCQSAPSQAQHPDKCLLQPAAQNRCQELACVLHDLRSKSVCDDRESDIKRKTTLKYLENCKGFGPSDKPKTHTHTHQPFMLCYIQASVLVLQIIHQCLEKSCMYVCDMCLISVFCVYLFLHECLKH